ncbi:hypothetical protein POTOM_006783 [Populus tomentosa]|uniref:Uncharacterized protein n=1 Tax=Populus tomentosa TaxID=118781 RepID=A0A8X8DF36_POPTO|nr:hypothetical protein POTOM_006783 [Populus tomentosa]
MSLEAIELHLHLLFLPAFTEIYMTLLEGKIAESTLLGIPMGKSDGLTVKLWLAQYWDKLKQKVECFVAFRLGKGEFYLVSLTSVQNIIYRIHETAWGLVTRLTHGFPSSVGCATNMVVEYDSSEALRCQSSHLNVFASNLFGVFSEWILRMFLLLFFRIFWVLIE